jgi:integrase
VKYPLRLEYPSSYNCNELSSILNRSVKEGVIGTNPCGKVKKLKVRQERDRILSGEEIGNIQERLKGTKDGLMVLVALFGGLRLGEVLSLKWSDVDFVKRKLTVFQSKTGKLLTTPIADCLLKELEEYKENSTNERLFDSGEVNTKLVIKYSSHFSRLFKRLGIERFTFHNLRHCFATYQSNCGSDAFITKELLGHASVNQTAQYTHKGMPAKRNAIKEMEKYILGMVEEGEITDINSICGTT